MNAAGSEHGDLELGVDWRSTPWLGARRGHQVNVCVDVAFSLSGKSLYTPDNSLLFWLVLGTAKRMFDLCFCGVLWDRYLDDNVGSKELVREIGNYLEIDGNSGEHKRKK